jgi:hypothetical protein
VQPAAALRDTIAVNQPHPQTAGLLRPIELTAAEVEAPAIQRLPSASIAGYQGRRRARSAIAP